MSGPRRPLQTVAIADLPCPRLPAAVSPPRFHRRAALRPLPLPAIKGAPMQHRAAPRPSHQPPRPPVRASAAGSPSAVSAAVDSSGEPPSDLFFASNRSTTPPPYHSTCSPPTSGAGLPEYPTAVSATVVERHPLFPSCYATSLRQAGHFRPICTV
jgi:hypothetical protein